MSKDYTVPNWIYKTVDDAFEFYKSGIDDPRNGIRGAMIVADRKSWPVKFLIRHAVTGKLKANADQCLLEFLDRLPFDEIDVFRSFDIDIQDCKHLHKLRLAVHVPD